MLSRQVPLVGQIDKQVLIAAAWWVIHLPPASLSANNCKNATKMDLGGSCATERMGHGHRGHWSRL